MAVQEQLRIADRGLVTYNRVLNALDDLPVSVCYFRADIPRPGSPQEGSNQLWEVLEPRLGGGRDFSVYLAALDQAQALGVRIILRFMTCIHPLTDLGYPSWVRVKSVAREDGTIGRLPAWEHPAVKAAIRNTLQDLGDQVRNHPAFLGADYGVLGVTGEWHTHWGGWYNADFMPSIEVQKEYVDMHNDAFGASKCIINLDMPGEIIEYALNAGANGWRQDGFGGDNKLNFEYPGKFGSHPRLLDVTGPRFFEIWGGHVDTWEDDPNVTKTPRKIMEQGVRWESNLFANMGWEIPSWFEPDYLYWHLEMMGYERGPEGDPVTITAQFDAGASFEVELVSGEREIEPVQITAAFEVGPRFVAGFAQRLGVAAHFSAGAEFEASLRAGGYAVLLTPDGTTTHQTLAGPSGPPSLAGIPLPYPSDSAPLTTEWADESLTKRMASGLVRVVEPRFRPRWQFGYRALDKTTAEELVAALSAGDVEFIPRTWRVGDPAQAVATSFACRVLGPLPSVADLREHTALTLELEAIRPLRHILNVL